MLAMPLLSWSRDKNVALICSGLTMLLYLLFFNWLLPVKLYEDKIRLARYRRWLFFPRTDVYFKDIKSIKIRTINKIGKKEMGSTRSAGASAMIHALIVKDMRDIEYINIIFDRKTFKTKLEDTMIARNLLENND
jgi:hypothetical protein